MPIVPRNFHILDAEEKSIFIIMDYMYIYLFITSDLQAFISGCNNLQSGDPIRLNSNHHRKK